MSEEKGLKIDQALATSKLVEKLKKFPPPLNNISEFLQKHQAVLTGSFLFSCVMDTSFQPNDIDVVFGKNYLEATLEMEKLGWCCGNQDRLKSREGYCNLAHVNNQFNMVYKGDKSPLTLALMKTIVDEKIDLSKKYDWDDLKFNFIVYGECENQSDIRKCIDEHFDLDGTTLQYDGKSWHLADDVNLDLFLNHKMMIYRNAQLLIRAKKEENPHSLLCNDVPWELAIHNWIEDRLKKYESRGFTIMNAEQVREYLQKLMETLPQKRIYVEESEVKAMCRTFTKDGYFVVKVIPNARDSLTCIVLVK